MLGIGSLPRLWPNRAEPIKPNTIMNNQDHDVRLAGTTSKRFNKMQLAAMVVA